MSRMQLWADELRTTDKSQGRGQLRLFSGGYCCLGIACEIYKRETGKGLWSADSNLEFHATVESVGHTEIPPKQVLRWFGISQTDASTYVTMNDLNKYTFKQIANEIEKRIT